MKSKQSIGRKLIGVSLLAAGLNQSQALAASVQSATTAVTVTTSDFLVLSYYDTIALTFAGNSGTATLGTATSSGGLTMLSTTALQSVGWGASASTANSAVNIALTNAWAVRGLSTSGTTRVAIAPPTGSTQVLSYSGSNITLGSFTVRPSGGSSGATVTATLLGLANPTEGDVLMNVDFSTTTRVGTHSGGSFILTATNI